MRKEDMDSHREAEDAKGNIRLPDDICERGRDEESEREIENPVCGGAETDTLCAVFERGDFAAVYPMLRGVCGGR
jgi:hypothetical protein